jgi:hypothetical protein
MNLWTLIFRRAGTKSDNEEHLERLERNDARVEDLHMRAERILNENHLGPAIRRALEGH